MFDGEPQDIPGECNCHLYLGDNHITIRCHLPMNHEGPHQEEFERDGGKVVITWEKDERAAADAENEKFEEWKAAGCPADWDWDEDMPRSSTAERQVYTLGASDKRKVAGSNPAGGTIRMVERHMPKQDFAVGDRVRILKLEATRFSKNHEKCEGMEGVVKEVDNSDSTLRINIDVNDQDFNFNQWFCQQGVELIRRVPPEGFCACDGPEKIVMILFQPVRVCTACKKEKAS